ncbi:MAG: lysyl oxidase family protein [Tepidisphaeraceae bacterium]
MRRPQIRRRKSLIRSALWLTLERLESRTLLCANPAEMIRNGIPASMLDDVGYIQYSDYVTLSEAQQSHIDPHFIEGGPGIEEGPVDYDRTLGIPTSFGQGDGVQTVEAAVEALPDFFPSLSGTPSIDQTSQGGRTLLRFGTQANNMGAGPAILISGNSGDAIPSGAPITSWIAANGSQNVIQAVYHYDSVANLFTLHHYLASGQLTYHPGHGHFHFDGYAYYRLRQNVGGVPGDYVNRPDGTGVVGAKTGFALINLVSSFTLPNGQNSSTLPGYASATSPASATHGQPPTSGGLTQGIHVGHADVYGSSLEGQWLDVTGVPNGSYFLEVSLDGENSIIETDEANNAKNFAVTLNVNPPSGGISPDQFDTGTNNNTFANAKDMGVMGTMAQTGLTIHYGADFDYFRFTASSSGSYTVTSTPANGNVDLYLYDSNQVQIGASTKPSGTETITYSFVDGQTYYLMAQAYNSTTSSNYQVAWNLKPSVGASSAARTVAENNPAGLPFEIARNGPTNSSLVVQLQYTGSAVPGVDYVALPTTVTFDAATSVINLNVVPIDNTSINSKRPVKVTVLSSSAYVVGAASTATITIIDDDASTGPAPSGGDSGGLTLLSSGLGGTRSLFSSRPLLGQIDDGDNPELLTT